MLDDIDVLLMFQVFVDIMSPSSVHSPYPGPIAFHHYPMHIYGIGRNLIDAYQPVWRTVVQ